MTTNDELLKLAREAISANTLHRSVLAYDAYIAAANPARIIALVEENEMLRGASEEAAESLLSAYYRTSNADDLAAHHIARQALGDTDDQ